MWQSSTIGRSARRLCGRTEFLSTGATSLKYVQPTVDPLSVRFPSLLILNPWYEKKAFPAINFTSGNYQGLVVDARCTETQETDTQWMFDSVSFASSHS